MQPPLANVFRPLINVFEAILNFFHDDIGLGWGLAIIALTLLIRLPPLPLPLKQLRWVCRVERQWGAEDGDSLRGGRPGGRPARIEVGGELPRAVGAAHSREPPAQLRPDPGERAL